jgi:Tfp pilus assembly protein PilW
LFPDLRSERGISLVEILLAMMIFSGVLVALGGLMFQIARQNHRSAATGYRSAATMTAASWARALPWDSIDTQVGCLADSSGLLAYSRCTTVQAPSPQLKQITVVISATGQLVVAPETVVVNRPKPRSPSPFAVQ